MTVREKGQKVTPGKSRTNRQFEAEVEALRVRLGEAEETLRAIRNHEIDALVVDGPEGQQVFTLQGAEHPYRVLVEAMSEGALIVGIDGTILYCNDQFTEMLNTSHDTITGASFHEILPSEEWGAFKASLGTCGKEGCRGEYHLAAFGEREIPVLISARRLLLPDVEGFCVVATDLTGQHALEQQVQQVQKMEAIGTLAGGIAHDFNNMLAVIIGFTEMAIDDNGSHESGVDRSLKHVLKAAFRGRDLVKQILAFSRKSHPEVVPLRLTPLIRDTVKFLRASLPATVKIDVKIKSKSDTVLADPSQMQQVVMNLCTNAGFAMRDKGGRLTISLSDAHSTPPAGLEPRPCALLSIKDTGTGMEPYVIKKIFEPFFTTKERGQGTGMGLAVAYGIIKSLEGEITVESTPGKGSTFNVFIPQAEPFVESEELAQGEIPRGKGLILFVDDDEALVEWGRETLLRLGYEVVGVAESREALSLFLHNPLSFDVVITDYTMPVMTGFALAKELLKVRPDIPIILYTGHNDNASPEKAKMVGIKEFLMKPLAKRVLAETVRRVLNPNKGE
ncbi:MAG TPA: ATP-binding protein [Syntrophorhabdaceae bacterium]|jgi:PAS domain S-box-containing protein